MTKFVILMCSMMIRGEEKRAIYFVLNETADIVSVLVTEITRGQFNKESTGVVFYFYNCEVRMYIFVS